MIRTIVLFVIIFGLVVISHEFGHFLIGRRNGIRVVEFAVGLGPTLFSFTKGGTKYSLKLLPFGGACMFEGEDGLEQGQGGGSASLPDLPDVGQDGPSGMPFPEAGVWARIATVFAGPFFNFILAFVVAVILTAFSGVNLPVVDSVEEGSAAAEAGLQKGDVIVKIDREPIHFYQEIRLALEMNHGETVEVVYEREGQRTSTALSPHYSEEDGRYYMGITGGEYLKCNPLQVFRYGFYEVEYWVRVTYKSLLMLVRGQVTKDDVAGPVGIAQLVGTSYTQAEENYGTSYAILTMLEIVVLLSVNLGIMNLLPLPALDGGRLAFMLVEVVRGKPVPPEKEGMVHFAGLLVLMALMVFIMYNDIMRLVR
ncbi:MAG: RIP metalloprotease RseP [bacterium]|nr:RIP metalloprotease RseP [bacterium]MCM1422979.1 RIP metalloprotease RseP [bacterium]